MFFRWTLFELRLIPERTMTIFLMVTYYLTSFILTLQVLSWPETDLTHGTNHPTFQPGEIYLRQAIHYHIQHFRFDVLDQPLPCLLYLYKMRRAKLIDGIAYTLGNSSKCSNNIFPCISKRLYTKNLEKGQSTLSKCYKHMVNFQVDVASQQFLLGYTLCISNQEYAEHLLTAIYFLYMFISLIFNYLPVFLYNRLFVHVQTSTFVRDAGTLSPGDFQIGR